MYCPDCGHNNPEGNKFCGMCGEPLPARRPDQKNGGERQRERIAQHDPEPVAASLRHREPLDEPVHTRASREESRTLSSMEYAAEPQRPSPIEQSGGISGPSFLGISSTSESAPGYSYLYEDEPPKSHAGLVVFLLVMAVLGGVLYYEWQPLHTWVVNKAQQKVDVGAPAPTQGPATPGSSTASSDNNDTSSTAAQPTNQQATPQNDTAAPDNSTAPKNAAPADNPKPDQAAPPKDDQEQSKAAEPPKPTKEAESKKVIADAKKAKAPKESAAREERTADGSSGEDLVASGERYLYGHGVPQNCQQAVIDFNAAGKQDNSRAMAHLGALYATGECVPLNRVTAYRWFSRALAKDRSNTYLENNMTMLWREMDQQEKAQVTGEAKEAKNSRMF